MNRIAPLGFALFLSAAARAQDAPVVKEGRVDGVYYGHHVEAATGGVRRCVIALRRDGTALARAPEGGLEEFSKGRALTDEERKCAGTYEVRGRSMEIRWAKGAARASLELTPDGRLSGFTSSATDSDPEVTYVHVRPWKGPLAGHFEAFRLVQMGAGSHMMVRSLTLWEEGYFQHGLDATLFAESVEYDLRTEERRYGDVKEIWRIVTKQNVPISKSSHESVCGRAGVEGSALVMERADGRRERPFVGVLARPGDETYLLIDGWVYKRFGAERPEGGREFRGAAYALTLPADWKADEVEQNGRKVPVLQPARQARHGEGVVLVMTATVDASKKAVDKDMVDELRKVVRGLPGFVWEGEQLEYDKIDGAMAARILMSDEHLSGNSSDPRWQLPKRLEAHLVVKGGTAVITVATWTHSLATGLFPLRARSIARSITVDGAGSAPAAHDAKRHAADDYSIELPAGWTVKELVLKGQKSIVLLPSGAKYDPEGGMDFLALSLSAKAGGRYPSAGDRGAADDFRAFILQTAPGAKEDGDVETFKVDGEPAIGLRYKGKSEEGEAFKLVGYAVVKNGTFLMMLVRGTDALIEKHLGAARKCFESTRVK